MFKKMVSIIMLGVSLFAGLASQKQTTGLPSDYYWVKATVVENNTESNITTIVDSFGDSWEMEGVDFREGSILDVMFDGKNTFDVYDDEIYYADYDITQNMNWIE